MPRDPSRTSAPHVAVLGGGAAGIAAARHLAGAGARVTLLEAAARIGGCVRTIGFRGDRVDVGAEALFTAAPEPLKVVADLGLTDDLVASRPGVTWIASPRGLRPLPAGVGPAGPTRLRPLLASRLLGPAGLARAALEPLVPWTRTAQDSSVGDVLTRRFGRQVVDRIVDPLLGGLHAGDVHRLGLDAATPQLAALLGRHRSILLATRRRPAGGSHGFVTLQGGLGRLFEVATERFVGEIRTGVRARSVVDTSRPSGRYRIETDTGDVDADAVVVAVPAHHAGCLLGSLEPETSHALATVRAASVAVALLAYPLQEADRAVLRGTGVLVPSTAGRLLKAATFVTTKWPHLSPAHVLVRASAGRADDPRAARMGDDELVAALVRDLAEVAGLDTAPLDHRVVRWDHAMPQLEVGHRERIQHVRARLASHPGVALAGASYDGVGVASAVRSGTAAAHKVLTHLTGATP